MAHGDAVINGDRVELARDAASFLDGLGDLAAELLHVHVAGEELGEGIGDRHDGLAEVLFIHTRSAIEGAGTSEHSTIHNCCRSHLHASPLYRGWAQAFMGVPHTEHACRARRFGDWSGKWL